MRHIGFLAVVLALSAPLDASERITVREGSENGFVATLNSAREFTIEEAQLQLLPTASDTCNGLVPVFGRYTFSSSRPASAKAGAEPAFEFQQTFNCEKRTPVVPHALPTVFFAGEDSRLVEFVQRETEGAIASPEEAKQRAFHSWFSPSLNSMLSLTEWLENQGKLHQNAGPVRGKPLLKVTTYTDPPNAPEPGTYVAIDFQAEYERAPFRCGYVMWLRNQAGKISILRLEDGIVSQKEAGAMTGGELAQTKQQFRCIAP